jgi:hypothetical protein
MARTLTGMINRVFDLVMEPIHADMGGGPVEERSDGGRCCVGRTKQGAF